jgi:hypothetical protein
MAIQKIRQVPHKLPYAHLYLDDVEDISKILLEAYTPVLARWKEEAKVTYRAGDLQMDSIEDLQIRGGSTTDFGIRVGNSTRLEFSSQSKASVSLYSLGDEEQWVVYAKIKAIFDARQLTIKNAIAALPGWLKVLFWLLVIILGWFLPSRHQRFGPFIMSSYLVFVGLFSSIFLWSNRVSFVRSHEHSKASSTARRGYIRDIIFLAAGAAIAEVTRHLASYFFK